MITRIVKKQITRDGNDILTDLVVVVKVVHDRDEIATEVNVTGVSNAVQAIITAPGHVFKIHDELGIEDPVTPAIISGNLEVLAIDGDNVTVDFDTSAADSYVSGGSIVRYLSSQHGYRLTPDELAQVIADPDGVNSNLVKQIATTFAETVIPIIQAQEPPETKSEDDTEVNLGNLAIAAIVLITGFAIWGISNYHAVKARKEIRQLHCADFTTQIDAQKAYENGAKYLDSDNDGVACESLIKK